MFNAKVATVWKLAGSLCGAIAMGLITGCSSDDENKTSSANTPFVSIYGSGSALSLPKSIQVGGANKDLVSQTSQSVNSNGFQTLVANDPGTDFSTDPVDEFNVGMSNTALEILNPLLCYIDRFSATSRVNQGIYKANINIAECVPDLTEPEFVDFWVHSYRIDDNSPHVIQLWVEYQDYQDPSKKARGVAEFIIHQAVSSDMPYGKFEFSDWEYVDTAVTGSPVWRKDSEIGFRATTDASGLPRLEMGVDVQEETDPNLTAATSKMSAITQITSADFQEGKSWQQFVFVDSVASISIATGNLFNATHSHVISTIDGGDPSFECELRKEIETEVWNYKLYAADTGVRLDETQYNLPLIFGYTHDANNDRNNKDTSANNPLHGASYTLYYYSGGYLSGVDWYDENGRNIINLEDGTLLSNDAGAFITKAVELAYYAKSAPDAQCAELDVSGLSVDPDLDLNNIDPIPAPTNSISNWPVIQ